MSDEKWRAATDQTHWDLKVNPDGSAVLTITADPPLVVDELSGATMHDIVITMEPEHVNYLRQQLRVPPPVQDIWAEDWLA